MNTNALILLGCSFTVSLFSGLPSFAAPITITSASNVTLDFNGFYDSSNINIPGLSGRVNLSNFVFTNANAGTLPATIVSMNYTIINNSTAPVLTGRISNFAFDTTPTLLNTALNQVTGVFNTVAVDANQPNGIGTVEVCFTAVNCPGGGGGGVSLGNSGGGTASIYFGGNIAAFTLDNAFLRYQSVTCSAAAPCNASASGGLHGGDQVPEPSTYVLMTLGLAGLAFASRYTRRA